MNSSFLRYCSMSSSLALLLFTSSGCGFQESPFDQQSGLVLQDPLGTDLLVQDNTWNNTIIDGESKQKISITEDSAESEGRTIELSDVYNSKVVRLGQYFAVTTAEGISYVTSELEVAKTIDINTSGQVLYADSSNNSEYVSFMFPDPEGGLPESVKIFRLSRGGVIGEYKTEDPIRSINSCDDGRLFWMHEGALKDVDGQEYSDLSVTRVETDGSVNTFSTSSPVKSPSGQPDLGCDSNKISYISERKDGSASSVSMDYDEAAHRLRNPKMGPVIENASDWGAERYSHTYDGVFYTIYKDGRLSSVPLNDSGTVEWSTLLPGNSATASVTFEDSVATVSHQRENSSEIYISSFALNEPACSVGPSRLTKGDKEDPYNPPGDTAINIILSVERRDYFSC